MEVSLLDDQSLFFETDRTEFKKPYASKKTGKRNKNKQRARPEPERLPVINQISPKTDNQKQVFDLYRKNTNMMLSGYPGTGKTFLSIFLAMQEILAGKYEKLVIIRSAVASRDQGFMPGNQKEKQAVYEAPYFSIFEELFGRSDSYKTFKDKGIVEFMTTSFIRGLSINNAIIVFDEVQNTTYEEAMGVITRVGKNSKILICGDFRQTDLTKSKYEVTGFHNIVKIVQNMGLFEHVDFKEEDIVRSEFVKQLIITAIRLEDEGRLT